MARGRGVRAPDQLWSDAEAYYITHDISYREIAKQYGVSPTKVDKQGKARQWPRKRREYLLEASKAVVSESLEADKARLRQLVGVSDKLDDVLTDLSERLCDEPDILLADLRGVSDLSRAIKDAIAIKRDLYGLPTQSQRERQRIDAARLELERERAKREQEQAEQDKDIRIVVEGGGDLDG